MVFPGTNGQVISVLYVDDEPALLTITRKILERSGNLAVSTAASAAEAIELLSKASYDAIVSDYLMPEMDGIAFLKHIRAGGDRTPFIIFTGKGREEVVIEALNSGADFYLQKGGDPKAQFAELANKIMYAVGKRQAEQALAENEERFRALIENTSDLIRILDRDGVIVFDSAASGRVLGYPPGYTMGKSPLEFIHPDDRDATGAALSSVYQKTGNGIPSEFRIRKADGTYTWAESIGMNLIGVPGIDGIVVTTRFIDERKQAEAAIRESEEWFRQLFERSHAVMILIEPRTGAIIDVNPAAARFYGYSRETLRTMHIEEINQLPPETVAEIRQQVLRMEKNDFIFPHRLADGTVRTVAVSSSPIENRGQPYLFSIVHDITDQKRAEDAIRESHAVLRGVIESPNNVVIFALDREYRYIAFNENHRMTMERIWGADIAIGHSILEYIADATDREKAQANFDRALAGESFIIIEEYGDLTHERRWYEDNYNPVFDDQGTVIGLTVFLIDITERRRTEEALRESEEQYRLIADNTADNIWIFDMDFNLQYISPSVKKMKGFTVEEQLAMPLETTMTPASYAAVLQRFQDEMALEATGTADPGRTVTFETEEYCSDGLMIAVENAVTLLRDDQGRPVGILGISRDITGRKRVEEALRSSAEQYRALVEGLPDIVMRFDCAGRHLFVSENVRDLVDIPAADFIGKTHAELGFSEAQCQFWEEAIRGVCGSGAPAENEFTFAGRKGETIFNWRLNPEFDEQGAVTSVLSISRDITLHRQAERNYQTLFREMLDGFALHEIILDDEGEPVDYRFLAVNPAFERMTGRRADEIVGRTVLDVFPGTERHWIETYGRVVLTGEPVFFHEYSAELAKYFEVTAFRPAPRQFACIFVDNTGRRQAEDALRLAHRKLRILSGITRHDILNKVMALEGFLALACDLTSGPEQAGYLDQVGMAATAILRHSEFTRAYEELGLGQPAWFPVADLVGKIGDRRLPLRNDCGEVSLYADPMIEKVFSNLLDNTLRHGTGATRVHLSCEESGDALRLICEDDGCGIPADQKERIFERGVGKNTGFGLLLSREILAITGITITETGEPGKGARFEMAVPPGAWRRNRPDSAGNGEGA
ncbi:MAG: PAS domain S-box protein [Methanoregulaceae archaeon]|jgi:PAS domain S-box-containing protein